MNHNDLCEHTKIRLIPAAVGHQQCTKTAANIIPIPGGDRVIAIGTPAQVRALLADDASPAPETAQADNAGSKAAHWFDTLAKCARLLELPDDEPIPSGVLRRVTELAHAQQDAAQTLTVWYGAMPESNGRQNYTAILHRKGLTGFDIFEDGFTIDRSEYPDRVRFEADRVRYLIGERAERPEMWDKGYDFDKHSDYTAPSAATGKAATHATDMCDGCKGICDSCPLEALRDAECAAVDAHHTATGTTAAANASDLETVLRDMLAIQEACGLHTDEYAPGSVIEYIKELEDSQSATSAADAKDAEQTQAARDVLAERRRQVEVEGWHPDQDDDYEDGQLSMAAACYATQGNAPNYGPPDDWPWNREWWKPTDDRRNLVKAAALILADIERIDRAAIAASQKGGA